MNGKNNKEEKLRILFVGMSWPPVTFLGRLVKGLADAGEEVTVACSKRPGIEWISHPEIRWLKTPAWNGFIPFRVVSLGWRFLMAFIFARQDLQTFSPYISTYKKFRRRIYAWNLLLPYAGKRWDLIYFPWNSSAIAHLPLFELGSPVVISCRGSQINIAPHNPTRSKIRKLLSVTFQRAKVVHCVSEAIKMEAARQGLDPAKSWIIRPAVDPEFFCPGDVEVNKQVFRVITVGSLNWVKGYEYALLAVRKLADAGIPIRLEIIGKGPELARVLYTIDDLGLKDHVILSGRLRPEEIKERLQQADAFVLSSLSEGISNAALEAMACEKPIVTTNCGGMQEAVEDGVEGFVVSIRDSEGMANALQTLWQEPKLRRQMGVSARKRIIRDFNLENQIEQFRELYHSATKLGSPPPIQRVS
jgi:glycosyltransferase involved in cell wall biosynthesis